jgi:hypothetical protein
VPCRPERRQRDRAPGRIGIVFELHRLRSERLGGAEIAGPVASVPRSIATLDATVTPPSGSGRPSSAAAVASAHRSAAACSPESSASHARARQSRGSLATVPDGRASSQRIIVALRPVCSHAFHDRAIRSAAAVSCPPASM